MLGLHLDHLPVLSLYRKAVFSAATVAVSKDNILRPLGIEVAIEVLATDSEFRTVLDALLHVQLAGALALAVGLERDQDAT